MTQMAKQSNGSSSSAFEDLKLLNVKQDEYVKLIQFKKDYISELNAIYSRENEGTAWNIFNYLDFRIYGHTQNINVVI